MKVALVCDWLTNVGGAEKVLLELHRLFPKAPIYTSQYNPKGIDWFLDADVKTGSMQKYPPRFRRFLGPLRQKYFENLDLSEYDLIVSVTGAEAKAVKSGKWRFLHGEKSANPNGVHISYCHVPTQYYWQMYDDYVLNPGFGILNPVVRFFFKALVKPLRRADFEAASRVDQFVTISEYAKGLISKYYKREAVVVHPPVEVEDFSILKNERANVTELDVSKNGEKNSLKIGEELGKYNKNPESQIKSNNQNQKSQVDKQSRICEKKMGKNPQAVENFDETSNEMFGFRDEKGSEIKPYIVTSRQVNWKRIDLAVKACASLGRPLLVIGDGPEHKKLFELSRGSLVRFLPTLPKEQLAQYLRNARGYLFPSLEPFGIAPVEALAAGCPVIAYGKGGALDYIQDGVNGILFEKQTVASLKKAILEFEKRRFDVRAVALSAIQFNRERFDAEIMKVIDAI